MKICLFSLPQIRLGKYNIKDSRLDLVDKIVKAKKKTYIQVELTGPELILDSDAVIVPLEAATDLILRDLEFIETRASRSADEAERALLNKLKAVLEKEEFLFKLQLVEEEKRFASGYGLATKRPVVVAQPEDLDNTDNLFARVLKESGFISFFTAGPTETRAWLIRQGTTAWEAAGLVHSDIQQGFIRAEIISFEDFVQAGGETGAKQAGKLRLEQKEYLMQDADLTNFRFNK